MPSTSSNTSVAVNRRPSSRAPAWAVATNAHADPRIANRDTAEMNFLPLNMATPRVSHLPAMVMGLEACGLLSCASLTLMRAEKYLGGLGISMMGLQIFSETRRGPLGRGM